jgi:hypothetical protein
MIITTQRLGVCVLGLAQRTTDGIVDGRGSSSDGSGKVVAVVMGVIVEGGPKRDGTRTVVEGTSADETRDILGAHIYTALTQPLRLAT